jgi:beta-lactamase superfamily II metal-dependent hydrolase
MPSAKKSISIRMYNVGLGDSFLLRFPCAGGERTVLIDCGVHTVGPGPHKMEDVVTNILDDVKGSRRKARIDVVIASHRHRDHVSGFADERWRDVEVGEVWLPWTEDREDREATEIREMQSKKAERIARALRLAAESEDLQHLADNCLTNAEAMAMLHGGFAGRPKVRFLPPKERAKQTFTSELLPGVLVHAMGPSRDREVIRDMNPPKGESYLRLAGDMAARACVSPFDRRFFMTPQGDEFKPFMEMLASEAKLIAKDDTTKLRVGDPDFLKLWTRRLDLKKTDVSGVNKIAEYDPLSLVVALDKAVNGTSLMLMFEMRNAYLLFPGDAQWGTWQAALADPEWRRLLEKTTFLKVGHHGSHNSTPVEFVEEVLGENFSGMVCTHPTTKFREIPREPLLQRLRMKSRERIARSDLADEVSGFTRERDRFIDTNVPI